MGAVKISKGIYEYKGYRISNCGYYEPDHCIWWEAVDMKTGCADYHATTKKFLMEQIDDYLRHFKRHFLMNLIYCKHYRKKDFYYVSNKKKFLSQIQIRISD